jgi:hypothetical protein
MNPERWRQVEKLYYAALEKPAALRSGFLAEVCGVDSELHHRIESLLANSSAKSNIDGILDRPA